MKAHRWNVPKKEEMTDIQCLFSALGLTILLSAFIVSWVIIILSWVS